MPAHAHTWDTDYGEARVLTVREDSRLLPALSVRLLMPAAVASSIAAAIRRGDASIHQAVNAFGAVAVRWVGVGAKLLLVTARLVRSGGPAVATARLTPLAAAELADQLDPPSGDPLAGARRRTDDNLKSVFG